MSFCEYIPYHNILWRYSRLINIKEKTFSYSPSKQYWNTFCIVRCRWVKYKLCIYSYWEIRQPSVPAIKWLNYYQRQWDVSGVTYNSSKCLPLDHLIMLRMLCKTFLDVSNTPLMVEEGSNKGEVVWNASIFKVHVNFVYICCMWVIPVCIKANLQLMAVNDSMIFCDLSKLVNLLL